MSKNQFSALDNAKWFAILIRTRDSFKITTRKRYVFIDIGWPSIWNQCFYLGTWNDDRPNMIVLPSFQIATRLNSQNRCETDIINELWHINLYMNIGISSWHNWSFYPTKMKFFKLFLFLKRLLTSKYMNLFCTYLVERNGAMRITCFLCPKNAKKNQLKR